MPRVVHFEIHAADTARCVAFYRAMFGWTIDEWVVPGVQIADENRYWVVSTGPRDQPGIDGGMVIRRGAAPVDGQAVNAYVCTIDVASLDESIAQLAGAGGTLTVPKMPIKGMGWLAYAKDTEGNIFGMMQMDQSAA